MREAGEKGEGDFFTKDAALENNPEKQGIKEAGEKFHEGREIDSKDPGLEHIYRDLDKNLMNRVGVKYGKYIPAERLTAAKQVKPEIQSRQEFETELKHRFPADADHAEQVMGYQVGSEVHVKKNSEIPTTLAHERFHQIAHPESEKVLGNHLYEGMTEDLANQEYHSLKLYSYERMENGDYKVIPPPEIYPEKRATLNLIKAQVPESCLFEAYFQGNDKRLESFIDSDHGKGAWKEIKSLLEKAEKKGDRKSLEKARKLLKS
jgi:hypothetical protein